MEPNVITRILIRGKQESQNQRWRCDNGSRGHRLSLEDSMSLDLSSGKSHKPRNADGFPEAGEGKKTDSTLEPPERLEPC